MDRLTKRMPGTREYLVDEELVVPLSEGYTGKAIKQLALFENVYESLLADQEKLSEQIEALRLSGRGTSSRYKQLIAKKISNSELLFLFDLQELL